MKFILKIIFNIARNISLVLVILFFLLVYYFEKYPEAADRILAGKSEKTLYQKSQKKSSGETSQSIEIPEYITSLKKLSLPMKGGTAYLRPSQIMYVYEDSLVTTTLQKLAISLPLYQLFDKLQENEHTCFFKTKNAIFNCYYILQILQESTKHNSGSYSYQYYVVMEDARKISISDEKAKELKTLLEKTMI